MSARRPAALRGRTGRETGPLDRRPPRVRVRDGRRHCARGRGRLIKQGYTDVLAGESLGEILGVELAGLIRGKASLRPRRRQGVLTNPRNAGLASVSGAEDRPAIRRIPSSASPGAASGPPSSTNRLGAPPCGSCATQLGAVAVRRQGLTDGPGGVRGVRRDSPPRRRCASWRAHVRCRSDETCCA